LFSGSQGVNCFPNCLHFPAKFDDFGLKYCILKENSKKLTSGGNSQFLRGSITKIRSIMHVEKISKPEEKTEENQWPKSRTEERVSKASRKIAPTSPQPVLSSRFEDYRNKSVLV
jgi:hypothetical protein